MVPQSGVDTYIKKTAVHPKYGFVSSAKDYAFDATVVSQRYGTTLNSTDPNALSLNCIGQSSSNCSGFSTDSFMKQTWFVNDLSNTASTANVSSYTLTTLSSANWTDAGF